jgi:hypothetical protein
VIAEQFRLKKHVRRLFAISHQLKTAQWKGQEISDSGAGHEANLLTRFDDAQGRLPWR